MRNLAALLPLALSLSSPTAAQLVELGVPLEELRFELPPELEQTLSGRQLAWSERPRLTLQGGGEVWLGAPWLDPFQRNEIELGQLRVGLRAEPGPVRGTLILPESGERHPFTFVVAERGDLGVEAYHEARYLDCAWRVARGVPGGALWRYLAGESKAALEPRGWSSDYDPDGRLVPAGRRRAQLDDAYALVSGGRALAENLALDDVLEPAEGTTEWVELDSVQGITTPEYAWGELVEGLELDVDPLARLVPHDQYLLIAPSVAALGSLVDEVERNGAPLLELFEARSERADVVRRYEQQLCVGLDPVTRSMAGIALGSVALTGSDPYLRTGTDLAVLLEPRDASAALSWIRGLQQTALERVPSAVAVRGEVLGVDYEGIANPARSVCSYLTTLEGTIVVTNSLAQLEQLVRVQRGETPSVAGLDEYRFQRHRNPRTEAGQTAFVLLSDATIRRWCSPRWRIATARRTRAAALLAQEEAARLYRAGPGGALEARARLVVDDIRIPGGGRMLSGPDGVRSEIYGTTRFQTPIRELEFARVTGDEARAYKQWRRRYEAQWTGGFDPIGASLRVADERLELDLSVRPLAAFGEYREWLRLTSGGDLAEAGLHAFEGALAHATFAIDPESPMFRQGVGMLSMLAPDLIEPLAWIGPSFTVFMDADEYWSTGMQSEDPQAYFEEHAIEMPIGIEIESRDPLRLAAFLAGMRAFVEQSAPGLVEWQPREHEGRRYVALVAEGNLVDGLVIYYATLRDRWVLSVNEGVIQRALARAAGEATEPESRRGQHVELLASAALAELAEGWWRFEHGEHLQRLAWDTLPLLNELHRLRPDIEPAALLAERFGSYPLCPGGGKYLWDEEYGTFASTAFGHPGAPRMDPALPSGLRDFQGLEFGVSFEEGEGLRVRGSLAR